MAELPKIAQIGAYILRTKAKSVIKIEDKDILSLIDSLIATAIASKGVGIAAPQISQPYRLFIISSHPSDRYPHAPTMSPTAMINPRILNHSQETVKDWEGCLSVPNVRGLVPRYRQIEVEYTTQVGEIKQEVFTDFIARIFQHELDHLDGILFVDRIENEADLYTEAEYQEIITDVRAKVRGQRSEVRD
ncbi:peptide deformylase [Pleurocapsa sp. FMAR1]|uniref:peptide deformylase n=1 Tax=Pleurocapsa sp. FMAR1 TaxID=3040204 RepID=UPI0029C88D32|nr:peptide deformylase [Pleurocapsa sp. FMAR1]